MNLNNFEKQYDLEQKLLDTTFSEAEKEKILHKLVKIRAKNNRLIDDPFFIVLCMAAVLAFAFFFSDGFRFIWSK
ncbi:hypothetical protein [Lysinibacillus fusiformis]|uniref:hypothetical protein n=1 Tax=Lysinibacillus fusiformis TaxID=28031 RepID=UPI0018814451|nr:hypothetical protein [Lysinibacillus fusiformis]MBD8523828.1 hypothetical protein [Lysinibacillus fusiformis]